MTVTDVFDRPLRKLRISITDRCNLRCAYCMPEESYTWLPREDLLSFEEIGRLATLFRELGVDEIRLTGGEPLLRRDVPDLIRILDGIGFPDLAMTSNAMLLPEHAGDLRAAGLARLTISLDTLRPDRFAELTRRDGLERTLEGIRAAIAAGFPAPKINTVVMRGINDDEICDLLAYAGEMGMEQRFIEYMDVGGATHWESSKVLTCAEILDVVRAKYGSLREVPGRGSAPAARWELPSGQRFGVIASTTRPFCGACDRARLVADGRFFLCLYAREGLDLRAPLRSGASDEDLRNLIRRSWTNRTDRGAERRLATERRGALASSEELARDPHLEMHTRGG